MMQRQPILIHILYGLSASFLISLTSCSLDDLLKDPQAPDADQPISNVSPVPASPASGSATPSNSFVVLTAPGMQPPTSTQENYACITPDYVTKIIWQQNQPTMSFERKETQPALQNVLAQVKGNPDGSLTYEVAQDAQFYTRVYPDRTCVIQVVDGASGSVAIEANGSLGGIEP